MNSNFRVFCDKTFHLYSSFHLAVLTESWRIIFHFFSNCLILPMNPESTTVKALYCMLWQWAAHQRESGFYQWLARPGQDHVRLNWQTRLDLDTILHRYWSEWNRVRFSVYFFQPSEKENEVQGKDYIFMPEIQDVLPFIFYFSQWTETTWLSGILSFRVEVTNKESFQIVKGRKWKWLVGLCRFHDQF